MTDLRLYEHPVINFKRGRKITIMLDGKPVTAFENETVAAALYAAGLKEFSRSIKYRRPRGFFCAIGKCSSCLMEVNGVPNVRTCTLPVRDGMSVRRQRYPVDLFSPILNLIKLTPQSYMKMFTQPSFIYKPAMQIMRQFTGTGKLSVNGTGEQNAQQHSTTLETELLVVGGGPAGLSGALEAGRLGVEVTVIDDKPTLGGQLVKQTHTFFSDIKYAAGKRGYKLGEEMVMKLAQLPNVKLLTETTAVGYYPQKNIMLLSGPREIAIKASAAKYLLATGAYEKSLLFENNDLPGIYGAGGVQTLLNVHGIKPGERGLMIGTGNVALMVTYHLLQAGVEVVAVVAPSFKRLRGYQVHAAKVRRHGVPIVTRHTIVKALGSDHVRGAIIQELDRDYNLVPGTEKRIDCDFICIGVGLTPAYDLVWLFEPKMKFISALGGFVPLRDREYRFKENAYIAGDCSSIEEATTAVLEGSLAGLYASKALGKWEPGLDERAEDYRRALDEERSSPFSAEIIKTLREVTVLSITEAQA